MEEAPRNTQEPTHAVSRTGGAPVEGSNPEPDQSERPRHRMAEKIEKNHFFTEYLLMQPQQWEKFQFLKKKYEEEREGEEGQASGGGGGGGQMGRATQLAIQNRGGEIYAAAQELDEVEKKIQDLVDNVEGAQQRLSPLETLPQLIKRKQELLTAYGDHILNLPVPPAQIKFMKEMMARASDGIEAKEKEKAGEQKKPSWWDRDTPITVLKETLKPVFAATRNLAPGAATFINEVEKRTPPVLTLGTLTKEQKEWWWDVFSGKGGLTPEQTRIAVLPSLLKEVEEQERKGGWGLYPVIPDFEKKKGS